MNKIREIPQIRALFSPYINAKRKRAHERYLQSCDSWYLKTLKGIYAGKRCFIIGNGPSLRAEDLDKLKGEYSFAANRIFEILDQTKWRPSFYLIVDIECLHDVYPVLSKYDLGHMFIRVDEKDKQDEKKNLDYPIEKMTRIFLDTDGCFKVYQNIWNHWSSYISEDVSNHFSNGCTVTFESIQLAIYMGFTEIYLLGVDFNYSVRRDAEGKLYKDDHIQDYFNGKKYDATIFNYNSMLHAYQIAREYCDNHDIVIKNATRGGKLEVFERVDFDEIIDGKVKE